MVDQLQRAGYGITYDEVLREAPDAKAIGRPHVAKALIAKGLVPDIDYAFRYLLRTGMPGYVGFPPQVVSRFWHIPAGSKIAT